MTKDIQKTALRLPRELHTAILDAASKSGRTMNGEIVYRLQQSLDGAKEEHVEGFHTIDMKVLDHRNYPPQIGDALRKIEDELRSMRETILDAKNTKDTHS